ncbi:hypothetical protein J4Q44_G00210700 [Coregonus suidteri]|uniref:Uncharacterized protein n=1 Tax=Coregonus suidteri TaxID=861788 RepID=A0AAN8LEB4_9TELE
MRLIGYIRCLDADVDAEAGTTRKRQTTPYALHSKPSAKQAIHWLTSVCLTFNRPDRPCHHLTTHLRKTSDTKSIFKDLTRG